jgi:hypothetical protein
MAFKRGVRNSRRERGNNERKISEDIYSMYNTVGKYVLQQSDRWEESTAQSNLGLGWFPRVGEILS